MTFSSRLSEGAAATWPRPRSPIASDSPRRARGAVARRTSWLCLALCAVLLAPASAALAQPAATPVNALHEGGHDFDFDLGVWTTHITRRVHPLSGSDETMQLTGTVTVRPLWGGRAQVEEIEADGPAGHWEGMTVFLYDPQARQWSMNFANSAVGKFSAPMIGSFENGRAELYQQDILDGRSILVRALWSDITPTSHTYQESYSVDGGKTWEVSFTARKTRK